MANRSSIILALATAALAASAGPGSAQDFAMGKFTQRSGEAIWKEVCQGCHMPDARGAVGAGHYPALAGDARLASPVYPVVVLLHGQKGMPNFGPMMDDAQIAAITNFVRTNFGNRYKGEVTPAQVAALRAAP